MTLIEIDRRINMLVISVLWLCDFVNFGLKAKLFVIGFNDFEQDKMNAKLRV